VGDSWTTSDMTVGRRWLDNSLGGAATAIDFIADVNKDYYYHLAFESLGFSESPGQVQRALIKGWAWPLLSLVILGFYSRFEFCEEKHILFFCIYSI
jgi:hypothetical protein